MPSWVAERVDYIAQHQNQPWMPRGIPIVTTSKEGEDIPVLEMIVNNESSIENQPEEIESEITSNPAEDRIEEALVNQDTIELNADPLYMYNNLGMIKDSESNENTETQSDIINKTFDNTNLSLGQQVNILRRS